jgi:hypothetical protein
VVLHRLFVMSDPSQPTPSDSPESPPPTPVLTATPASVPVPSAAEEYVLLREELHRFIPASRLPINLDAIVWVMGFRRRYVSHCGVRCLDCHLLAFRRMH